MKDIKKYLFLAILVFLMAGIAGCSQKEADPESAENPAPLSTEASVKEDDGVYLATIEKKEQSKDGSYARFMCQKDGYGCYLVSKYDEVEERSRDYLRKIDLISGEQSEEDLQVSLELENYYVNEATFAEDGYIILAGSFYESGHEYYIARITEAGEVKGIKNLADIIDMTEDTYITGGMLNDGINTYIPFSDRLIAVDENLNYKKTLSDDNYAKMCLGSDGILYFTAGYDGEISTYDPKTDKLTEDAFSVSSSSGMFSGREGELLISSDISLKSYDIKTGEVTKLFDYLDVNINGGIFDTVFRSKDGDIHIIYNEYEYGTQDMGDGQIVEVSTPVPYEATVKRYEQGAVPEIEEIKLVCFYANPDVRDAVVEFNKSHPNIRAKIKSYSDDYTDYQKMNEAFDRDLLNGEKSDVIMFGHDNIDSYVEKGLLENILPYIEKDSSFDLNDYYENILFAYRNGDTLYRIASQAGVDGFLGLTEVFGDKEKITFEDIVKARAEFPDIPFVADYNYDTILLSVLLDNDYRVFLGGKEGEYDFNTKEFRELCELCASFPKTPDEGIYLSEGYDGFSDGSVLMGIKNYYGSEAFLMTRSEIGKNVKFYGGPSPEGNGYFLDPSVEYSISSLSTHKEEAWELIKYLLRTIPDYSYGFRASKEAFKEDMEKMRIRTKNGMNITMGDRKYVLFMNEDDDVFLEDIIKNATPSKRLDNTVRNIVFEEIQPYFAKQKSLDDVIKVMQSRVNLYLAEKE